MTTVEEIRNAIEKLPEQERNRLVRWISRFWEDEWEEQISEDLKAGKLDKILEEVDQEIQSGHLSGRPLAGTQSSIPGFPYQWHGTLLYGARRVPPSRE
ncbi:MAG: hypothetical protein JRJ87_26290 [Deltaproteobacteria bacterium]|nr:hypothetical protein [Deltaproteobacteria bacterium]